MSILKIDKFELKPFTLKAKQEFESFLRVLDLNICDYSFCGNYMWLSRVSGFYLILENCFCLFDLCGDELGMLLPPIGKPEDAVRAIFPCMQILKAHNLEQMLKIEYVSSGFVHFIQEKIIQKGKHPDDYFTVQDHMADYIYEVNKLIELKGNSYAHKRNEINKFLRNYPNYQILPLDPQIHKKDVLDFLDFWVKKRIEHLPDKDSAGFLDGIFMERLAIKRMMNHYHELELSGLVVFVDKQIRGFTIGEKLNKDTASVSVEKTDMDTLGCAQLIFREFCKVLKEKYQIVYINASDDGGYENLKMAKMSYRPCCLVPKYDLVFLKKWSEIPELLGEVQ